MLKFLKNLFSKTDDAAGKTNAVAATVGTPLSKQPEAQGGVEVASLSLRAILDKLPADLKSTVNEMPASDVKVVLPVAAIMKQLPSGAVRMSLASLYRQAPAGTFRSANVEDKRLVDVPLSEVFKTISPNALKRRDDQRTFAVPDDAVGLFSSGNKRSVVAPSQSANPEPSPAAAAAPEQKLRMPAPAAPAVPVAAAPVAPALRPAAKSEVSAPLNLTGELSLLLVELAAGWQEGHRNELSVLPGDTRILIPASEVGPLLQKGKVSFSWAQLRRWLNPPASSVINIPDDTQLVLPLKIVAPAFVASTGAKKRAAEADTSLPDFFGPSAGSTPAANPAPAPVAPAPQPVAPAPPAAERQSQRALPPTSVATHVMAPAVSHLSEVAPSESKGRTPASLGELFGISGKTDWMPAELVRFTCGLPGVTGVVVALEEGLVVAEKLPEGFSAETFAAFMPQIFSRMDRYTGEMQLGGTNDVTLNTENGAIRLFRQGKVFFAALGKRGENLPDGLQLVCNELANQNS